MSLLSRAVAIPILLLLVGACGGCISETVPASPLADENERPTPSPLVEEVPEAPDPALRFEALDLECDTLLGPEVIYEFNPNVALDPGHEPNARGIEALAYSGQTCGWVNLTSGDTLKLSVARFDDPSLAVLLDRALAREGAAELSGNLIGTIRRVNGAAEQEVFASGYWITLESRMIVDPEDSSILLDSLMRNLELNETPEN